MKILFAIKNLNTAKGGAEKVLSQVSSCLAERGHDVYVLSFDAPGGESFYPLHSKITRVCIGIGKADQKSKMGETIKRIFALRKTLKHEQPDIAIGFMHSMFIPLSFAAIGTKTPIIASEHIVPEHYKNRRFEFILLMISSLFVRRITVLSRAVRKTYPRWLQRKMKIIRDPVVIQGNQKSKKQKIILNVGRLDAQKDQATLIKAFATIADDYPEWTLNIFGEGFLKGKLKKLITSLKLGKRVFLKGTTKNISSQYAKADIFAMSSRYESFGLATAEAMAHGVPAVGFADCPGTNELIIDKQNGVLVESDPDRVIHFANGLKLLIDHPKLRKTLGKNATQSATAFNLDSVTRTWEKTIEKEVSRLG